MDSKLLIASVVAIVLIALIIFGVWYFLRARDEKPNVNMAQKTSPPSPRLSREEIIKKHCPNYQLTFYKNQKGEIGLYSATYAPAGSGAPGPNGFPTLFYDTTGRTLSGNLYFQGQTKSQIPEKIATMQKQFPLTEEFECAV